jgi:peptidoglycan/LPS O-acetylase OafA/YrhL
MNSHFSLYLDILRFVAAACVLLSHANSRDIIATNLFHVSFGHNAVIVFFMLSGYVIAYVADSRERSPRAFWVSRLARIYSVALPVMLLTPMLDLVGGAIDPLRYKMASTHDYWWIRMGASLVLMNELWFVSIMPFSNSPYWSLCYEMCYYILFSVYHFERGRRRTIILTILCLIIGPKILVLMPIWVLGVFIYQYKPLREISERTGWLLLLWSLLGVYAHFYFDIYTVLSEVFAGMVGERLYELFHFSKHFLADYVLAFAVAANFIGFRAIAHRIMPFCDGVANIVKSLSTYTFALYLFHLPLLLFASVVIPNDTKGIGHYLFLVGLVFAACVLIGVLTEIFKNRLKVWLSLNLPQSLEWSVILSSYRRLRNIRAVNR